MNISELMTRDVNSCRPGDSLADAAKIMWENDCGVVPITDEAGRLLGVVTDRDACMAAYTQSKPLSDLKVTAAMSKSVECCHENEAVERVERLMGERQVRRLPVVDTDNRVVGIVSLNDIALHALRTQDMDEQIAVARTLGRICRHTHPTAT